MPIRALENLDSSSEQFPEQLDRLLHDQEWIEAVKLASDDELKELIDRLDNILDNLDSSGSPFRKCLHVLKKICSSKRILPSAYEVSGKLSCDTAHPVAYGGFCDAYRGTLDLETVCIKRLRISSTGDRLLVERSFCKEAVVWKRLNHSNIVPFKGVTFEPLQLMSEWIPGGELRLYVREHPEANLIGLLLGVAEGLGYLHSCNVIHGDLKGTNILVDAKGQARIVDFGFATIARDSNSLQTTDDHQGDTPRFTAPELLQGIAPHSKKSDIFAFAMVGIEVFTGRVPFSDFIWAAATTKIIMGTRPERPAHPLFTDHLWALTQRCWEKEPEDRPSVDSILEQLSTCEGPHSICKQPAAQQIREIPPPPSLGDTTSSFPSPSLPQPPGHLYGRKNTFKALSNLTERLAPTMLVGAAGTGKTAIVLTLLCDSQTVKKFGNHRYFVRCDNIGNSLDGFLERLSEAVGVPKPADLAQLRSHLEVSPYMLVLDGVDSILDPRASGAAEIATAIEELGQSPKVRLLATSRIDAKIPGFRRQILSTFSGEAARDTFHSHCSLERSPAVDNILKELDFHPLSIVLLASAVSENVWDEPALLEAWNGGKTRILKASGQESLEDCIESILRTPTIQELGTTARKTLEAIANYPAGVKETRLLITFPKIDGVDDAVDALCRFSLMYREDGFLKMLSPFRLHFQHTGRVANLVQPRGHTPARLGDMNMAEGFDATIFVNKARAVGLKAVNKILGFLRISGTDQPDRSQDVPAATDLARHPRQRSLTSIDT